MYHAYFFINRILDPITSDVMNNVTYPRDKRAKYKIDVKTIMRNDFKMIVFKQLTISIKTHDNKINVSCSANQQNVTLLNMTM
jgi:hypothetical protein